MEHSRLLNKVSYTTKDGHPLVVAFHRGCFDARADAIYFHSTGRAPSRDAIDRLSLTAVYNLDCSRYEEPEDDYAGGLRDVATQHGHGDDVQRSAGHDIAMADPAILDPRLLPQVSDQHDQSMNLAYKHQVLSQQPWLAKFVHDEDAAWDKVDWLRVATIDWTPSAAPHALASFANRAYIFKLWLKELQERSPLIEPLLLHHEAQGEIHHL